MTSDQHQAGGKAPVLKIGTISYENGQWILSNWMFGPGPSAAISISDPPRFCGWTGEELQALAEAGHD